MLFSQWQLLFGIRLLCTFGSRDASQVQVTNDQLLKLLLMTNGFYPSGESDIDTIEGLLTDLQRTALRGYSLIEHETPKYLIGRYAELFGRLAPPANQSDFRTWVDIQKVLEDKLGIQLDIFKAVLFALFGSTLPSPDDRGVVTPSVRPLPESYFTNMKLPQGELKRTLELVSTSPDEIRSDHRSKYGDSLGNPVDLGVLLRKPVIKLIDRGLAGISGQLLIQRYTSGLYWDINDALPNDRNKKPNRKMFQTFFGELHERYGLDTLWRIRDDQLKAKRQIRLLSEQDYASQGGPNPDSLVIESIWRRNTRCTLFEFKVGRPRYKDSIVEGDVQAFQEDLSRKLEDGLDQEIGFCRQLMGGKRTITDLSARDVRAWFFVIIVTDPFPAMNMFLEPLREKLAASQGLGNAKRYGPFVLSLMELEQLETLPKRRVSQLLMDWAGGPHRDWPFNTFYAKHTEGQPITNSYVSKLGADDLERAKITLFGRPVVP